MTYARFYNSDTWFYSLSVDIKSHPMFGAWIESEYRRICNKTGWHYNPEKIKLDAKSIENLKFILTLLGDDAQATEDKMISTINNSGDVYVDIVKA
jgi:hypothetical protein